MKVGVEILAEKRKSPLPLGRAKRLRLHYVVYFNAYRDKNK
jgi:hypothetical protein